MSKTTILGLAIVLLLGARTEERKEEIFSLAISVESLVPLSPYEPETIAGLFVKESGFRLDRVGKRGECGAGQVMPWFLRGYDRGCEHLQTPEGSVEATLLALWQWETWLLDPSFPESRPERLRATVWDCYASGQWCYAPDANRRLASTTASVGASIVAVTVLETTACLVGAPIERGPVSLACEGRATEPRLSPHIEPVRPATKAVLRFLAGLGSSPEESR